jgi:hypothetical protein
MPLRCFLDGEEVTSYNQTEESWSALKADYRVRDMKMVCCGNPAIPKTSSLGTYFFAHKGRGDCTSAPESKEHLLAKSIIAKAAETAGWKVTTECRGKAPDGTPWIADVLVTRGNAKLAFEIQWSSQNDDETAIRQKLYKDSGVRGLWLFKQRSFVSSQGIPAFRLVMNESQTGFIVDIPSSYDPIDRRSQYPYEWRQHIDLVEFIQGCLEKKLEWVPASGRTAPARFNGTTLTCWKCRKETRAILDIAVDLSKVYPGVRDLRHKLSEFDNCPNILMSMIPEELYTEKGVGRIKMRASATAGESYLSNGCVHCDALQGRFFDNRHEHKSNLILISRVPLKYLSFTSDNEDTFRTVWWYFLRE